MLPTDQLKRVAAIIDSGYIITLAFQESICGFRRSISSSAQSMEFGIFIRIVY